MEPTPQAAPQPVMQPAAAPVARGPEVRAPALIGQLLVYYLAIGAVIAVALLIWPDLRNYLPVGGVEQLISQPNKNPLEANEALRSEHVGNLGQSLFWLSVAITGAILCSLPVSRVYMAVRSGAEYDQSLVNTIIMLPIPELNEERRRELTKVAAQYAESARVAIRNVRRDGMDQIKKGKANGMPEDDQKLYETEIQSLTDRMIASVDEALTAKQAEIMQV